MTMFCDTFSRLVQDSCYDASAHRKTEREIALFIDAGVAFRVCSDTQINLNPRRTSAFLIVDFSDDSFAICIRGFAVLTTGSYYDYRTEVDND